MDSTTLRIRAGMVESSTISSGQPSPARGEDASAHCHSTSAPRLLPPIPSRTTCRIPSSRTSSANRVRSSTQSSIDDGVSSQPSRSVISVGSDDHRVWSPDQMRATVSVSSRDATASSAVARAFPSDTPAGAANVERSLSRLAAMFSSSSSNESANALTPSCMSCVVTASMLTPPASSAAITLRASSASSSMDVRAVPCSMKAASVASGMVLTVWGPMSVSTYRTSLYSGFLVLVDAHRGLCTLAPRSAIERNLSVPNVVLKSW